MYYRSDVRDLVVRLVTARTSLSASRHCRSTDSSWESTLGNTSLRVWDMQEIDAVDDTWSDLAPSMPSTLWGRRSGVEEAKGDSMVLQEGKEVDTEVSTACDVFLEAISTENLEGELLEILAPEVGVCESLSLTIRVLLVFN